MTYAHVTNGTIDTVGLPAVGELADGRTVSNYNRLDDATLRAEGWVPVVDEPPTLDDPVGSFATPTGWELVDGAAHRTYTVGYQPPSLNADRLTIPADGATAATFTYRHPDPAGRPADVTFDVNGAAATVALDPAGVATIDVTAAQPGRIDVTAGGITATLTAEEA